MQHSPGSFDQSPQAKKLLENQAAIRKLLSNPETKKVLQLLRKQDSAQLQQAAQAAMKGDASALNRIMSDLSRSPEAAKAMEHLNQSLNQ